MVMEVDCHIKLHTENHFGGDYVRTLYEDRNGVNEALKSISIFGPCTWEMET